MELRFSKYQGAGNDFVAIDMTSSPTRDPTTEQLQLMCNRKKGIGADGVLILRKSQTPECQFRLIYYNADGKEGSLCGNGSRCSLAFAERIRLVDLDHVIKFEACDGTHCGGKLSSGEYFVDIRDVALEDINRMDDDNFFLHTGSPHHIRFVDDLRGTDVPTIGRDLRWNTYGQTGANINFVEVACQDGDRDSPRISVRTFERGVEAETLACGTGATAAAIAAFLRRRWGVPAPGDCEIPVAVTVTPSTATTTTISSSSSSSSSNNNITTSTNATTTTATNNNTNTASTNTISTNTTNNTTTTPIYTATTTPTTTNTPVTNNNTSTITSSTTNTTTPLTSTTTNNSNTTNTTTTATTTITTSTPVTTQVSVAGGVLAVRFGVRGGIVRDIRLCGPAIHVFDGTIDMI